MTNDENTPKWLIDTQNKSWEPEILISGITLTFLFILSSHIYNFCAMLIQDFGVYEVIGRTSYIASMVILTGLKITLIIHLLLRGLWAGLVGLSYVFPQGIKRENLPPSERDIDYDKPHQSVIKIERICSLLFSFIFSSIASVGGIFLVFIPVVLLFMMGLSTEFIHVASMIYALAVIIFSILFSVLLKRWLKNSHLRVLMEKSILNTIIYTYTTNVGRTKTWGLFIIYFAVILLLCRPYFNMFNFENEESVIEINQYEQNDSC